MKRFLVCLLASASIVSCGKQPDVPRDFDLWFQPFLDHFKRDADAAKMSYGALDTVTVFRFDTDDNVRAHAGGGALSYCQYNNSYSGRILEKMDLNKTGLPKSFYDDEYNGFYKEIVFSEQLKNVLPQIQYKTFLHEMGHCVYDLSHNPDYYSIMYWSTNYFTKDEWPKMLSNYFKDAKNNQQNWGDKTGPTN